MRSESEPWSIPLGIYDNLAAGLIMRYRQPINFMGSRRRSMPLRRAKKIILAVHRDPAARKRYSTEQIRTAHKTLVRAHNRMKWAEWKALSEEERQQRRFQAMLHACTAGSAVLGAWAYLRSRGERDSA